MPNWCSNRVTFKHTDPKMIRCVIDSFNEGRLMQGFYPCPQDLIDTTVGGYGEGDMQANLDFKEKVNLQLYGYANWYDWCVNEWGTEWDVGAQGGNRIDMPDHDVNEITLSFESAWSPPIGFYKTMETFGFEIEAMYYEPGMGYCGSFDDGVDSSYTIPSSVEEIANDIPADIDECFAISENLTDWQE